MSQALLYALTMGREAADKEVQNLNPDRGACDFKLSVNIDAWMEMKINIPYYPFYDKNNTVYGIPFTIEPKQKEKYLLSWDIGLTFARLINKNYEKVEAVPFDSKLPTSKELIVEW